MKKMMKKCMVVCAALVMTVSSVATAYAQSSNQTAGMMIKQYQSEDGVGVEASPRGQLISTITLELSEEGYRTMGLYSEILCHEDMKKIKMSLKLQRYVDSRWKTENSETFEWTDADDEHLNMAVASYNVGALPAGKYRISAAYVVYDKEGMHESKSITTAAQTLN